jgi:hypothetical protein
MKTINVRSKTNRTSRGGEEGNICKAILMNQIVRNKK